MNSQHAEVNIGWFWANPSITRNDIGARAVHLVCELRAFIGHHMRATLRTEIVIPALNRTSTNTSSIIQITHTLMMQMISREHVIVASRVVMMLDLGLMTRRGRRARGRVYCREDNGARRRVFGVGASRSFAAAAAPY